MSPELFDPESFGLQDTRPTKQSDGYALGMLIYEVLSGRVPFPRYHDYVVIAKILKGERPGRPHGTSGTWFTDEVWGILERCWEPIPDDRPRIEDVLQCLENASWSWTQPSPQAISNPLAIDPSARIFDSNTESTDESEISPLSQVISSHPSRKRSSGDPNENNIQPFAYKSPDLPHDVPDHQDLESRARNPSGSDLEEPPGRVS